MGRIFQFDWEVSLILWLQSLILERPYLKGLFIAFTQMGEPALPILMIGFLYWGYRKKWGLYMTLCILNGQIANAYLKNIFCRLRPYMCNENITCFYPVDKNADIYDVAKQGYSFPSGHSTSISGFMASLWMYKKLRPILYVSLPVIALVTLSRFALGVHYPTDVIGGGILGAAFVLLTDLCYDRMQRKHFYLCIVIVMISGFLFCRSEDYYSLVGVGMGFMAGDLFEEKYVRFRNTRNVLRMLIRTVIGVLVFIGLSQAMKLPFDEMFLNSGTMGALLFRSFRYLISTFCVIALYPYLFRYNIFNFHEKKQS